MEFFSSFAFRLMSLLTYIEQKHVTRVIKAFEYQKMHSYIRLCIIYVLHVRKSFIFHAFILKYKCMHFEGGEERAN